MKNTTLKSIINKLNKNSKTPIVNTIRVLNGIAHITDLNHHITFPLDKPDGLYNFYDVHIIPNTECNIDEFPLLPTLNQDNIVLTKYINTQRITDIIKYSVDNNDTYFNMCFIDKNGCVSSTNSHILYTENKIIDNFNNFEITGKMVSIINLLKFKGFNLNCYDLDAKKEAYCTHIFNEQDNINIYFTNSYKTKPNISGVIPDFKESKYVNVKIDFEKIKQYSNNKTNTYILNFDSKDGITTASVYLSAAGTRKLFVPNIYSYKSDDNFEKVAFNIDYLKTLNEPVISCILKEYNFTGFFKLENKLTNETTIKIIMGMKI